MLPQWPPPPLPTQSLDRCPVVGDETAGDGVEEGKSPGRKRWKLSCVTEPQPPRLIEPSGPAPRRLMNRINLFLPSPPPFFFFMILFS